MESSTTSSIPKNFKYDVFLSFRGEDTRSNFIDHLYFALLQNNINTYKDNERIKKGKMIRDELMGSIEDSKFYLIVFSKNYASSSWCLDELVKIMECHKTTQHTAYPVFYDVEPSEVRKQSWRLEEAWANHEKEESVGKWREALKEAANLAGWELKNTADGHEAKFIQKVVEELSLELRSINSIIDEKLVGMESRIKDVVSSLETGVDDVRMIGIKGMGGGGKTTLARAVFDQISFHFEGKSFVENVREVSKASLSGLKSLQYQVLSDVLNDESINIRSVSDGKNMIKRMMLYRKVLVVLDDVDHVDQLEALAGDLNWFKPGSRIIITTRDEQVLVAHKVKLIRNVSLLSDKEAICLFSRHTFGREIPIHAYEELSRQVVRYAAGLPLTIRVLGSFLCGKNELEWKDALERLKQIPLSETLEKLELSYIGLEEDYKEIFLDVACILKGQLKDYAIEVLESCGFHARNGLRVLEKKSLITIYDTFGREHIGMHDHIEEMGKNIVRRSHPDMPCKHSRLWIEDEIENILVNDMGTEEIRCIRFYTMRVDSEIVMKGLRKMKGLRFLDVYVTFTRSSKSDCFPWNWKSDKVSPYFPDSLRYLRWNKYPFRSLPKRFQANQLVTLQMGNSQMVQLWEGGERKVVNNLICLRLKDSKLRTLDLGLTPNLETLKLEGYSNLVELYMPGECPKIKSLVLDSSKLRTFDLGLTPNLEELTLGGGNLVELHMPSRCLNLRSLLLNNLKLRTLDLGLTPYLEKLTLRGGDLVELHIPGKFLNLKSLVLENSKLRILDIGLTPNLEDLYLKNCYDLEEFHMADECTKLRSLNLYGINSKTLDLRRNPDLESLILHTFNNFEELHMPDECQMLTYINIRLLKLRTLDLRSAPNLKKLVIVECDDLVDLYMPGKCLNLEFILFSSSKLRTLDIGLTPNLEFFYLPNCFDLEEIHMADECPKLASLDISNARLRTLDIRLTPNLQKLHLKGCHNLVQLHAPIGCLKKLVDLDLSGCLWFRSFLFQIKIKGDTSCRVAKSPEVGSSLELYFTPERCPFHPDNNLPQFDFTCFDKEALPSLIGNLEKLISVDQCACTKLETFSISIYGLKKA